MWESFGESKATGLLEEKFRPKYRIGLTNYLRERWIFKLLPLERTDIVADIGCASGRQVFRAAKLVQKAIGTDIAESFISAARKQQLKLGISNVEFITCPIERITIPNESINKIICSEVIEHILEPHTGMRKLHRILKSDGRMLITVPNYNADGTLWGRLLRQLRVRTFTPITEFTEREIIRHGDAHVREFSVRSLKSFLKSHGFKPVKWTTVSMIDFYDRPINLLLRISILRMIIIWFEMLLSILRLPFGRHIIMLCRKSSIDAANKND